MYFFFKKKMKFKLFFIFLFIRIKLCQVELYVQVDPYLPRLYTWNLWKGRYEQILNKKGGLTKNYPGGIYLQQF